MSSTSTSWAAGSDIATTWSVDNKTDPQQPYGNVFLAAGTNKGTEYSPLPLGYIYATPASHGMTIPELGIAMPELLNINIFGKNAQRIDGDTWGGSLLSIDIFGSPFNNLVFDAERLPFYEMGYQIFNLIVSVSITTDLFSHSAYKEIWTESSDITTSWGVDANTDASSTSAPVWTESSDITTSWAV